MENYKKNPQKTWSTINNVLNRPSSKNIPDHIIIGEQIITDKTELANHFSTYFGSIGAKTASAIDKDTNISFKDYLVNKNS